ncbi:MAG TPA: carbohydrate-binding family 9-like protein [Roseiflexaceae bacterium]|nr:carbohydrate-binding family 9-like protein [Roseiflexaceae bacterium]
MKTRSQPTNLPHLRVPRAPAGWNRDANLAALAWESIAALPPFVLADGSQPAIQQTVARVCYDEDALYIRFDCQDRDIWATYSRRDDSIYDEEVVEVFIAPGSAAPTRYFEFEVSPNGVLLDALIDNPTSQRADLRVDCEWDCPGLRWLAERDDAAGSWWVALAIPWGSIESPGLPTTIWRANFYRIERPRDAAPEFSCWSPTYTEPADFHKPECFGVLEIRD